VKDNGPARCPTCGAYLEFRTDRNGRMMEQCACGHRAFVERRTGKRDEPKREEPTQ
jgi:DNA-directed RNA polymerase subunit RPC12/RpoP